MSDRAEVLNTEEICALKEGLAVREHTIQNLQRIKEDMKAITTRE